MKIMMDMNINLVTIARDVNELKSKPQPTKVLGGYDQIRN